MKHFVFLVGSYFPEVNASNICVKNIIDTLVKQGHICDCVCFTKGESRNDLVENVPVYRVNDSSYLDIDTRGKKIISIYKKTIHFLHSIYALPSFPETWPSQSKKLLNVLTRVCSNNHIDAIIAVYNPFTTIGAAIRYHITNDVPIIGFFLDLIIDTTKPSLFPSGLFLEFCKKKEIETFKHINYLLIPEGKRKLYEEDEEYRDIFKKIAFFNFPTFVPNTISNCDLVHNHRFIFAGTTHSDYRNPMYAIHLFNKLSEHIEDVRFDMYGPSNIESQLYELSKGTGAFHYHGKVSKEIIIDSTVQSEFMISIGNNVPGMVASKTFELFTYCRPIIHFTRGAGVDTSLGYFEKYPDVCIINCEDDMEKSLRVLEDFIKKEREKVDYSLLKRIYYSATPEATVNVLMRMLFNN